MSTAHLGDYLWWWGPEVHMVSELFNREREKESVVQFWLLSLPPAFCSNSSEPHATLMGSLPSHLKHSPWKAQTVLCMWRFSTAVDMAHGFQRVVPNSNVTHCVMSREQMNCQTFLDHADFIVTKHRRGTHQPGMPIDISCLAKNVSHSLPKLLAFFTSHQIKFTVGGS